MTDEEKAIDLTSKSFELNKDKVEWFCSTYKNSRMSEVHTFYNGVLIGLAEGRKESCEVCEKASMKEYQKLFDKQHKIIEQLEKENAKLKAQVEKVKTCSRCMSNNKDLEEYPCKNCLKDGVYTKWH